MREPILTLAAAAALLAGLTGLASCGPPAEETERISVLWLTIDTLRADHLGCYGYQRPTSPNIDALAQRAVRFERAYASAPWTIPSVATMLTGLIPSAHGMYRPASLFPAGAPAVPSRFAQAGYRTAAVVSNRNVASGSGIEELFELFDDSQAQGAQHVSTPGVVERCESLLDEFARDGDAFFLFALLCDPHHVYHRQPGVEFAGERGPGVDGSEGIRELHRRMPQLKEADAEFLRALYDEEIHFTDRGVGRLLERLEALGLADSTLVVLTSDHGEEILERGWIGHTITLHEELVRVPLLLCGPGLARGRTVEAPVSLLELGPAALELARVPAQGFGPTRLAALARRESGGAMPEGPPIVFEVDFQQDNLPEKTVRMEGVVRGAHKLIRDLQRGEVRLFDLERDPLELHDLAPQRPDLARELEQALDSGLGGLRLVRYESARRELGERQRRLLEGLGYGGGEAD